MHWHTYKNDRINHSLAHFAFVHHFHTHGPHTQKMFLDPVCVLLVQTICFIMNMHTLDSILEMMPNSFCLQWRFFCISPFSIPASILSHKFAPQSRTYAKIPFPIHLHSVQMVVQRLRDLQTPTPVTASFFVFLCISMKGDSSPRNIAECVLVFRTATVSHRIFGFFFKFLQKNVVTSPIQGSECFNGRKFLWNYQE